MYSIVVYSNMLMCCVVVVHISLLLSFVQCLKEEGQALIQTVNTGQFVDPKAHHTRVQANGRKVRP